MDISLPRASAILAEELHFACAAHRLGIVQPVPSAHEAPRRLQDRTAGRGAGGRGDDHASATGRAGRPRDRGGCRLDIGVPLPPDLRSVRIRSWPWHVATAAGSELAGRDTTGAADLRDIPPVIDTTQEGRPSVGAMLREVTGAEPVIAHRVESMLAMAAAGLSAALVPTPLTAIAMPGLTFRAVAGVSGRTGLLLMSRRDEPSPAIRAYLDLAAGSTGPR